MKLTEQIGFFLRWTWYGLFINLFMWIAAVIFYPLVYPFRNWARANTHTMVGFTLWLFLDDEGNDYGDDWWLKGRKKNWWTAYLWSAVRNPMWNVYYVIKPKVGPKTILKSRSNLRRAGELVNREEFAVLKYVDKNGKWMDNKGEYLSLRYSILGRAYMWYKIQDTLYYRRSFTKMICKDLWLEFHFGTNDKRYTLRFKIKKTQIYERI